MTRKMPAYDDHIARLVESRDYDPFGVLGAHPQGTHCQLRVWRPGASAVALRTARRVLPMVCLHPAGLFGVRLRRVPTAPWRVVADGVETVDPYAFPPTASAADLLLFAQGQNHRSYQLLGAHPISREQHAGVRFRVWAPSAERVSVVGDFNHWDGRCHPLQTLGGSGVWELFIPGITVGARYKFELRQRDSGQVFLRADPYAHAAELRPAIASRVASGAPFAWQDTTWLRARAECDWRHAPLNAYELHVGSWLRHPDGRFYHWRELAERLVPYVRARGYTHIELLPITEHPLDESWGYQSTGFFAPSARFGDPDGLRVLIQACHAAGIGVLLDWVPGHFPADDGALAHFDGSALYEHADPRLQRHPDWGTSSFNYGRAEICSFLLSSAHYWLSEFHFDGLRVDAVASMLYLDYSRAPGEWTPNRHGGRENLEAVAFLRALNGMVEMDFPGVLTMAEESTTWPGVTHPLATGGLGFSLKWNMGWMNDSLRYFGIDPVYRRHHHALLTFGQIYAYSERFMLPLSHDEVVHGKSSLLNKMPGDAWQRYANVRLLLAWQLTTPGKKLGFMGNEFGQSREWACNRELDWAEASSPAHAGIDHLLTDLNTLYREVPALHDLDHDAAGFEWLDCNDATHATLSFIRRARSGQWLVVVLNFTPVTRTDFRLNLPQAGPYRTLLNSDSRHYGGSDAGPTRIDARAHAGHDPAPCGVFTLPPLAALILIKDDVDTSR